MSASIDKRQPYGNRYPVSQSGAMGVNLPDAASNIIGIDRYVLKDDDGDTIIVQPREYFGRTVPTAADYPNAEVGSVYRRFITSTVNGEKKATSYQLYELTAVGTWTLR